MNTDNAVRPLYPRPVSGAIVSRLPTALVPARRPLQGRYVELVPLDAAAHGPDLYSASHGDEEALRIWEYLADGPWPNVDTYSDALRQQSASLERTYYAIRPLTETAFCGQASFLDIHAQNGVIEIGHIWFGARLRRSRAATEAMYLMLSHAMDDLGYRRMQWRCNAQNKKSMSAAERLGFRFEGIFYNHLIYKGKNRDTAWFSILDDEWPELATIFREWLAPTNFTGDGEALASLSDRTGARKPGSRTV